MKLNCVGQNCTATIEINEPVSPQVKYHCVKHTAVIPIALHFQDYQFDRQLGSGTDPKGYERGAIQNTKRGEVNCQDRENTKERKAEEIEKSLVGHKNAKKILAVLNSDKRDSNG